MPEIVVNTKHNGYAVTIIYWIGVWRDVHAISYFTTIHY